MVTKRNKIKRNNKIEEKRYREGRKTEKREGEKEAKDEVVMVVADREGEGETSLSQVSLSTEIDCPLLLRLLC